MNLPSYELPSYEEGSRLSYEIVCLIVKEMGGDSLFKVERDKSSEATILKIASG